MAGNGDDKKGPVLTSASVPAEKAQQSKPAVAFKAFELMQDKAAVQASGFNGSSKERGRMAITRSDGKEEQVLLCVDRVEKLIMTENRDLRVSYEESPDEPKALLNLALLVTLQHWNRNQSSMVVDYPEEVRWLLSNGAEVNVMNQDTYGYTPLAFAIKTGNMVAIRKLISFNADVVAMSNDATTPLKLVAMEAKHFPDMNWVDVASLLIQRGAMVDEKDHYGRTPLVWACESGNIKLVELLLDCGANINAAGHEQGYTSLINAAKFGNLEMVKLLVERQADINVSTKLGLTSLMWAAANGHIEVVKELLKNGADPAFIDDQGRTASEVADQSEQWDIAEIIRKHQ